MNIYKTISLLIVLVTPIFAYSETAATSEDKSYTPKVFANFSAKYNTLDGLAIDSNGDIIASVPNFNNDYLLEKGDITEVYPAVMAILNKDNEISDWYTFSTQDLHPETGKIGPMECEFGPDGNLYIADMQVLWGGEHKSRVLRINIEDGKPVNMDVVVEGFIVANGLIWRGDTLYVTESILKHEAAPKEGQQKAPLHSGVYAFSLAELQGDKITLTPYSEQAQDAHLAFTMVSTNRVGFGADGIIVDDMGNMYTSIMEDGVIYKTSFDENNKIVETVQFTDAPEMISSDGLAWDSARQSIYVADILGNAVHSVDLSGKVTTLHKNGDTDGADGSLDEPVVLLVRDDQLIVVNMDLAWITPPGIAVNTEVEAPYALSVIDL
ncbi:MAG: hypothetical protein V7782_04640 [Psychromonas sp.]